MSISADQLREYIVDPVLKKMDLYSDAASNLMMGTCAQESEMGSYLHQINGPALGIFQMEPATFQDCYDNFLKFKPDIAYKVASFCQYKQAEEMLHNLNYACAMARIKYLRSPAPLPIATDIEGLAVYWKQWYNGNTGKGTPTEFVNNYKRYVMKIYGI